MMSTVAPLCVESTGHSTKTKWSFDSFFGVILHELLNKHARCWWLKTPWHSGDVTVWKLFYSDEPSAGTQEIKFSVPNFIVSHHAYWRESQETVFFLYLFSPQYCTVVFIFRTRQTSAQSIGRIPPPWYWLLPFWFVNTIDIVSLLWPNPSMHSQDDG